MTTLELYNKAGENTRLANHRKEMSKITTYVDGKVTGEETDEARIYKWLAQVYIMKHRGSKDVRRIRYHQKYDGDLHATYYLSNGTIVEVELDRKGGLI